MKKVMILLSAAAALLFLHACSMSPEDMVDGYNDGLIVINEAGTEWTRDGIHYTKTDLIVEDSFEIKKGNLQRITSCSDNYKSYDWSLKDADGNPVEKLTVTSYPSVYIKTVSFRMNTGQYTLYLTVTNTEGQYFSDKAVIEVVD